MEKRHLTQHDVVVAHGFVMFACVCCVLYAPFVARFYTVDRVWFSHVLVREEVDEAHKKVFVKKLRFVDLTLSERRLKLDWNSIGVRTLEANAPRHIMHK